jgi:ssDNA-binding Zn-finger/Zn-ribbon topoisomerase 1
MSTNPFFNRERQIIVCDKCGNEIPLQNGEEQAWSIFSVYCPSCGRYSIESKYDLESGSKCPRCKQGQLKVIKRLAATQQNRELILSHGQALFRFTHAGLVKIQRQSEGGAS